MGSMGVHQGRVIDLVWTGSLLTIKSATTYKGAVYLWITLWISAFHNAKNGPGGTNGRQDRGL
jgi:hypothetical protein